MSDRERVAGAPLVAQPTAERLSERELLDYKDHKRSLLRWAYSLGKNPDKAEGYSKSVIDQMTYQIDAFYRWYWDEMGHYTTRVTTDDADDYMQEIAYGDTTNAHKSTVQKCLKRLYKYRDRELGEDAEWDPEHAFSETQNKPQDFLTIDERRAIREAALELGSVPTYDYLSPEERDHWKIHLAQRFEKPKSEVGPDDFDRANGWKVPSMVWTSLDAGLRPIEVGRAKTHWVDVDNKMLRIPKEESSKNVENWSVALSDRTAKALERWLRERPNHGRYDGTDALWLTQMENPYGSQSLRRLLRRLCEIAEIPTENRQMSWYTIRHSVGTYFAREEDLAAAQAQLRHKSIETTAKYDQVPVEDRREALDRMG
jgi:site-specific recombinase XerD